jgi:hypothetical protein
VKDLVVHVTTDSKIKRQLAAMIKDLSARTGQTEVTAVPPFGAFGVRIANL